MQARAHTEQLVAAIHRRDAAAFQMALARLRPALADVMRDLRQTDPALARGVQASFYRLEALAQRSPLPWAQLLREAVLLEAALRKVRDTAGEG